MAREGYMKREGETGGVVNRSARGDCQGKVEREKRREALRKIPSLRLRRGRCRIRRHPTTVTSRDAKDTGWIIKFLVPPRMRAAL